VKKIKKDRKNVTMNFGKVNAQYVDISPQVSAPVVITPVIMNSWRASADTVG